LAAVASLAANKKITPIVDKVFPAREAESAFRYMMAGKHTGKLILDFSNSDVLPDEKSIIRQVYSPNTLYILSGGLGALGW